MTVRAGKFGGVLGVTQYLTRPYLMRAPTHIARAFAENLGEEWDRWIIWTPVIFGCGIATYFALDFEPTLWLGPSLTGIAALLLVVSRRSPWLILLSLGAFIVALGFATAQVRSHLVSAPVLERKIGPVWISVRVTAIQSLSGGPRVLLDRLRIPSIEAATTPVKARIRLHRNSPVEIGKRTSVLAKLSPPPAPVFPGAYDFQRRVWFEQIGAVGFALSRARPADDALADSSAGAKPVVLAITRLRQHDRRANTNRTTGPGGSGSRRINHR